MALKFLLFLVVIVFGVSNLSLASFKVFLILKFVVKVVCFVVVGLLWPRPQSTC